MHFGGYSYKEPHYLGSRGEGFHIKSIFLVRGCLSLHNIHFRLCLLPGTHVLGVTKSCAKKERLQKAYRSAASDYGRSVQVLERYLGTMAKDEYKVLRSYSDTMRRVSEAASGEQAPQETICYYGA